MRRREREEAGETISMRDSAPARPPSRARASTPAKRADSAAITQLSPLARHKPTCFSLPAERADGEEHIALRRDEPRRASGRAGARATERQGVSQTVRRRSSSSSSLPPNEQQRGAAHATTAGCRARACGRMCGARECAALRPAASEPVGTCIAGTCRVRSKGPRMPVQHEPCV